MAARGALLYFLLDSLSRIEPMYQFSLHAFEVVFSRAIDQATPSDELKLRLEHLLDSITYAVFSYARRGLFEKHKLIFSAQLCFRILVQGNKVDPDELDFLLRCPRTDSGPANPMSDWLKDSSWAALLSLRVCHVEIPLFFFSTFFLFPPMSHLCCGRSFEESPCRVFCNVV